MKTMKEKYQDAEKLLLKHTKNAVLNGKVKVTELEDGSFFYAKESGYPETTYEFIKVNPETGEKTPLFDHAPLRKALKEAELGEEITFGSIDYSEKMVYFTVDQKDYMYDPETCKLTDLGYYYKDASVSSDYYRLTIRDWNLYSEDLETGKITQLTYDGVKDNGYATPGDVDESVTKKVKGELRAPYAVFSHDGTKVLTYRLDQRAVKELYIIQGFDEEHKESIRPRLHTYKCAFPEDQDYPLHYLYMIDLKTNKVTQADFAPFMNVWGCASWSEDDTYLTATWVERGYQTGKMLKIDAETGECEVLVTETTDTFLNLGTHGQLDGFGEYGYSNFLTKDQKLAVFQSERDDFARYFAYDAETKECLGAITPADIIAEQMISADEEEKYIYFMGTHLETCSDPYYEGLCRVHFDGTGFEILTKEDAFHTIQFLKNGYVDTYSRVDLPPVTVLCRKDGTRISVIEEADITNLMNLGYIIPERFTATASDGKTTLYGIVIRPEGIKDGETVPYVDHIYGGPQTYFVPKKFTWDQAMGREIFGGLESLAKTGIAGVMIDGLGTPGLGKKLHDVSWQNIHGCNGLKDHVTIAAELKQKFPFIDIENAGIWGNSGGGCATSRALLEYPDYFKVGVSSAGNHDQRMYYFGWTERYYGLYNKEHKQAYLDGDNTALAKNLKGKLLIVHGLMDDNVTFPESVRLVDALIKEDKEFDMFVLPRCNHNVPADPYFQRRKLDYFVKHLLHEETPSDYHFE